MKYTFLKCHESIFLRHSLYLPIICQIAITIIAIVPLIAHSSFWDLYCTVSKVKSKSTKRSRQRDQPVIGSESTAPGQVFTAVTTTMCYENG